MQDKLCDICQIRPAEYVITTFTDGIEKTYEICEQDYIRLQRRQDLDESVSLDTYFDSEDPFRDISILVLEGELFEADNEFSEVAVESKDYFELEEFFSEEIPDILENTAGIARSFGWKVARSEHLLLALLDNEDVDDLMATLRVDIDEIVRFIEERAPKGSYLDQQSAAPGEESQQRVSIGIQEALEQALQISKDMQHDYIKPLHILLALLDSPTPASYVLEKFGVSREDLLPNI